VRAFYQKVQSRLVAIAGMAIAITFVSFVITLAFLPVSISGFAQVKPPEIIAISPTRGPGGTRVEIRGINLAGAISVLFGASPAVFKLISPQTIIAIVPHKISTSTITVSAPQGHSSSPVPFVICNDPRVPEEVSYKAGYVNAMPRPADFSSARLWGIAITDTRVPGHKAAQVKIAWTNLSCRIGGKDFVLNDDPGRVVGGPYIRYPWFGGHDYHEPMPSNYDEAEHATVIRVGGRTDRIWHFWGPSPRALLPPGALEGCTVKARVKISPGALLQVGFDYWRNSTAGYGAGGNNHEAGVSNWYFPSPQWQEATFTDIRGPQF
jgi:hypothetical protein